MATRQPDRLLTAEDLFDLPDDGNLYELVEGRLVRVPPSCSAASLVAVTLLLSIGAFVRRHKLGICLGEGGGVRTRRNPDTVRAPDISFISKERIPPGGLPPRYYVDSPDLAVEVLSPSDRFVNVLRKVQEYLAAGTRLVWVIIPAERSAVVFRPGAAPRILSGDATLDGEDVLPGFTLPLADLWDELADMEDDPDA
jgi:Uma2 family endonuclease